MNKLLCMRFTACVVLFVLGVPALVAQAPKPRVFLIDASALAHEKQHPNADLLKLVRKDADAALQTPPLTITVKTKTPPSGDKHDYMSMARYWWPNPDTKDHLPYVRHDGLSNPEIKGITDHELLDRVAGSSRALALGWYLTGDERYAAHATLLLRTFFLDKATAMNPNLEFAQYVAGVNTGRGTGVLDARGLSIAVDAVGMLAGSKSWTPEDQAALQHWFGEYYTWLTTSTNGKEEAAAANNHGSWYAVQAASIAMFLGKTDDAQKIAERLRDQRIPSQFDAQGMQKYELVRTNSFSYSAFNLDALTNLAAIVAPTGIDLYKPVKPGTPGILTGVDALLPYDAQHPWPHDQISKGKEDSLCPALIRTAAHTQDAKYTEAERRFDCKQTAVTLLESPNAPTN
ncbi:alginate lyase family protein [Granulicella mallensis]|uniref:Alginate lyase domain-containing protein n=1 Tax=Granulicella mallensis TaxID=940614 RepID=A0A7W8E9K5_9BACT|nr:alginate lyase family protein [Granulicella mallensis]MBB5063887.1 hypothetical protein [Granulicella mallensis]